jgi:hypothetical protein
VAFTTEELDFNKLESGGLHGKHAVGNWQLQTISAWRQRKTRKDCVEMAGDRTFLIHAEF